MSLSTILRHSPIRTLSGIWARRTRLLIADNFIPSKISGRNDVFPPSLLIDQQKRHFAVKGKEAWERKLARIEALKVRRKGVDRYEKKRAFRAWHEAQCKQMNILDRRARQANMPFMIRVFAVVERLPIIFPDEEDWEKDFVELKAYLECFGAVYPEDAPFMPKESENPGDDYMTDEQLYAQLPEGFVLMPRVTEEDKSGNVRSTNRKLAERIYLTIKENENAVLEERIKDRWTYPSATVQETETMLDAVQRAIRNSAGTNMDVWCPSNAPMGVQMRGYNTSQRESSGFFGEKLFFYKVQYDAGEVATNLPSNQAPKDFAWLSRDEIVSRFEHDWGHQASKFQYYFL